MAKTKIEIDWNRVDPIVKEELISIVQSLSNCAGKGMMRGVKIESPDKGGWGS